MFSSFLIVWKRAAVISVLLVLQLLSSIFKLCGTKELYNS